MSAHEHLGQQLRMFIPAKELQSYEPWPGDVIQHEQKQDDMESLYNDYGEPYERVSFWDNKKNESDERGITASIQKEGVHVPVSLYHQTNRVQIANGHHRIVASKPDSLVPVVHYGTPHHSPAEALFGGFGGPYSEEPPEKK